MKILVVYYSRSGHTQEVAQTLSAAVGGDLERIVDMEKREGVSGFFRSGYEVLFNKLTRIGDTRYNPADYDLVVVGSPVWAGRPATPVTAYLKKYQARIHRLALFITHASRDEQYDKVLRLMERAAARRSVGWLSLPSSAVRDPARVDVSRFASKLNSL